MGKGLWSKLFGKMKTKNKNGRNGNEEGDSISRRYGVMEELSVTENPLYEEAIGTNPFYKEESHDTGVLASTITNVATESETTSDNGITEAETLQEGNLLQIVAGMPTVEAIELMAGGLKMDKIEKHMHFKNALDHLKRYQELMRKSHTFDYSKEEAKNRRKIKWEAKTADTCFDQEDLDAAFEALVGFTVEANAAVNESKGLFARRSSNVRKLAPVFANLIVQANGLLPKLTYLENVITPYIIETDNNTFTYEEIINHQVAGGRSGGIAMRGIDEDYSSIDFGPEEILKATKALMNPKNHETEEAFKGTLGKTKQKLLELRKKKTEQARMNLLIPKLPIGALAEQKNNTVGEDEAKKLKESAEAMADSYIAELRRLMTALEDSKESYEDTGEDERIEVHDRQATQFHLSRLLYRGTQSRALIINAILNGVSPEEGTTEYRDLMKLWILRGSSLNEASGLLFDQALDPKNYTRLVDSEGKKLKENEDYKIGGGNASISILDKVNKKVLRAEKADNQYLSVDKQKVALNGIYDEAVGKVSQFLGLNVSANAEAGGFMAKEAGTDKETPVYGGSVMDMAEGKDGKNFSFRFNEEQMKVAGKSENVLNLSKEGKVLGDMMKLNILDYIVLHGDRNAGNFMLNLNAKEGESTIKAIDNDKVFGADGSRGTGHEKSEGALNGINNRIVMDFGFTLDAALPMITSEVKQIVENIDLEGLNQLLMPYTERVNRLAAVHRASELKEWVKKVPIVDLSNQKERQEYTTLIMKKAMEGWTRGMHFNKSGEYEAAASIREIPNMWVKYMILDSHMGLPFENEKELIYDFKALGIYTKEELRELFLKNFSLGDDSDQQVPAEMFDKSTLAKRIREDYDLPIEELRKKYFNK